MTRREQIEEANPYIDKEKCWERKCFTRGAEWADVNPLKSSQVWPYLRRIENLTTTNFKLKSDRKILVEALKRVRGYTDKDIFELAIEALKAIGEGE